MGHSLYLPGLADKNVSGTHMIDAIKMRVSGCKLLKTWPSGWAVEERRTCYSQFGGNDDDARHSRTYYHNQTGMRAFAYGQDVVSVEVSLPRVMHGNNGFLLKDQGEIDSAMHRMRSLLREVASAPTDLEFKKVELVWHFSGDTGLVVKAHQGFTYPGIRGMPTIYRSGRGLTWGVGDCDTKVSIYDKVLERTGKSGDVVRVEVTLRNQALRMALSGNLLPAKILDFVQCWQAYRKAVMKLQPGPVPKISKMAEFLAMGIKEHWAADGMDILSLWTGRMNPQSASRLRREVASIRPAYFQAMDWRTRLPKTHPPEAVEVNAHARSTQAHASEAALSFSPPGEDEGSTLDAKAAQTPILAARSA